MLDSHDTVRVLNTLAEYPIDGTTKKERLEIKIRGEFLDRAKLRLKVALSLLYFLPGNPCVYYGDEAGLTGYEDPMNRKTYPWGFEDKEILDFYTKLGHIRSMLKEEMLGETYFDGDEEIVHIVRVNGKKRADIFVNNTPNSITRQFDFDAINMLDDRTCHGKITVEPYGFAVLKKE